MKLFTVLVFSAFFFFVSSAVTDSKNGSKCKVFSTLYNKLYKFISTSLDSNFIIKKKSIKKEISARDVATNQFVDQIIIALKDQYKAKCELFELPDVEHTFKKKITFFTVSGINN